MIHRMLAVSHRLALIAILSMSALASTASAEQPTNTTPTSGKQPTNSPPTPADPKDAELPSNEQPWSKGVPEAEKGLAREHFSAANTLVEDSQRRQDESLLARAVEQYTEALKHWDHPAIHYNMAIALRYLDQPIEVRRHLLEAKKHGTGILGSVKAERLEVLLQRANNQISTLTVSVSSPGVVVKLDERILFKSPGRFEEVMLPGRHTLHAFKEGYLPKTIPITLTAGEATAVKEIELNRPEDLIGYRRRWAPWGPIALTAAGAAVAAIGGGMLLGAEANVADYNDYVEKYCKTSAGCRNNPKLGEFEDSAQFWRVSGAITLSIGGAALATGTVLMYLNQSIPYTIEPGSEKQNVTVAPIIAGNVLGIASLGRF